MRKSKLDDRKSKKNREALFKSASITTFECLVLCIVAEIAALTAGIELQLCHCITVILSFLIAYILGLIFLTLKRGPLLPAPENLPIIVDNSDKIVVLTLLLIVTNYCQFFLGIHGASSVMSMRFWLVFPFSCLVSFLITMPVSFWMLMQDIDARK